MPKGPDASFSAPDAGPGADAAPPGSDTKPPADATALDARPAADAAPLAPPLRVLFVGNSYTAVNDLPSVVRALGAATAGGAVEVEAIAPGGALLADHWNTPETRARISSGEFGVVVLQGQSQEPMTESESFHYHAGELSKAAREAGARPVWFATWARREGNTLYTESPGFYRDPAFMTESLEMRYIWAAGANQDVVARVGAAWELARTELPEIELYAEDGSHPSAEGTLLAACVLLPWITGKTATLPEPPPLGVSRPIAEKLCALQPRVWCREKQTYCGGGCVDAQTDTSHCGECDHPCSENDPCRQGACGCDPGMTGCSRSCVNLQTDARHCGGCGEACGEGEICVEGKCACPSTHLVDFDPAKLSALQPGCAKRDDYGTTVCALATHTLCQELACFTSGFGPSSGHAGALTALTSLACVAGDVRQTTYTALKAFEATCDGTTERHGAACVAAIHRYCASLGAVSGYGPVGDDGDALTVTCLPKATVVQTTLDVLRTHASRCLPDPVTCTTASWSFCDSQGHVGGFGPVEVSGESMSVVCVDP